MSPRQDKEKAMLAFSGLQNSLRVASCGFAVVAGSGMTSGRRNRASEKIRGTFSRRKMGGRGRK